MQLDDTSCFVWDVFTAVSTARSCGLTAGPSPVSCPLRLPFVYHKDDHESVGLLIPQGGMTTEHRKSFHKVARAVKVFFLGSEALLLDHTCLSSSNQDSKCFRLRKTMTCSSEYPPVWYALAGIAMLQQTHVSNVQVWYPHVQRIELFELSSLRILNLSGFSCLASLILGLVSQHSRTSLVRLSYQRKARFHYGFSISSRADTDNPSAASETLNRSTMAQKELLHAVDTEMIPIQAVSLVSTSRFFVLRTCIPGLTKFLSEDCDLLYRLLVLSSWLSAYHYSRCQSQQPSKYSYEESMSTSATTLGAMRTSSSPPGGGLHSTGAVLSLTEDTSPSWALNAISIRRLAASSSGLIIWLEQQRSPGKTIKFAMACNWS